MNIECKLLAMTDGFTGAISQALPPEVCSQSFTLQPSMSLPATWGVRGCPEVRLGEIAFDSTRWTDCGREADLHEDFPVPILVSGQSPLGLSKHWGKKRAISSGREQL
jgi:hypothetical protein